MLINPTSGVATDLHLLPHFHEHTECKLRRNSDPPQTYWLQTTKQKLKASKKARIAYWVESGGGVDGEEGDLVDLGAEDGELPGGSEVEAAVAGGELCVAGEEGVVSREDHPEGEAVPALDPCVAAGLVDAVRVPRRQLREAEGGYGER